MSLLLIVDDEIRIREVIKEYAQNYGHQTLEASDGSEAIRLVEENEDIDLVILDIMMPVMDGFTACRAIKKIKNIPVIMLSARQEEYDKLFGFEIGIDDYVTKPFSPLELMARVKVALERSPNAQSAGENLVFEGLTIDVSGHSVYVDGKKMHITPREFELLYYLAKNRNIVCNRTKLLEEVWKYDYFGDDRTVDTHIKMLRKNLGEYRKFIVTVRAVGYKFEV
ncbi:MAG: response regulator transcription factor [Erysipelotrichaceae bacterium]|jgi:DNA-binding response OmpR family regulator|nr:response regulator transcription factor [Erysipelotrichaceae bacterium]